MRYMSKQLAKEIAKNRLFLSLMLLFSIFSAFMYFFVQFSIDGNLAKLNAISQLSNDQLLYKNALESNSILAFNFLLVLTLLCGFVFALFFYRFFRKNKRQIGNLKSLGFKDSSITTVFVIFAALLSLAGAVLGLIFGYLGSSVLINASMRSFNAVEQVKSLNLNSLLLGLLVGVAVNSVVAFFSYQILRREEIGALLSGNNSQQKPSLNLKISATLTKYLPPKNRVALRIALRKPVALLMIVVAVMGFMVMFIMGNSLNKSSAKVYFSQTEGHNYQFDTKYDTFLSSESTAPNTQRYIWIDGAVKKINSNDDTIQEVVGLEDAQMLHLLFEKNGGEITLPKENQMVVGAALADKFGYQKGDAVLLLLNGRASEFIVDAVAENGTNGAVYINKGQLESLLELPKNAYNGALSMHRPQNGGVTISNEQKLQNLQRDSVSNRTSAVINQVIGVSVGCLLIFLALLINFQDNTRDMLILQMMGYTNSEINKMLLNVYRPMLWISFVVTLWPSIALTQSIQRSLSIQTGDYMPFGTSMFIIAAGFVLLNIIYFIVQGIFKLGIKKIVEKESILE